MTNQLKLSTRATDFLTTPASLRLGGITIYAPDKSELLRAYKTIADAIDECSKPHLSLTRIVLNSEVQKHLNVTLDQRIFGAILGSQLRLGILDSIPCAAVTGKVLRVYLHNQQLDTFLHNLEITAAELRLRRVVQVRDIEEKLFRQRCWGTWSSAFHILARLVHIGRACYVDRESFCWPPEIENAINKYPRRVRIIHAARMADNKRSST
jgi:hypothetical protein